MATMRSPAPAGDARRLLAPEEEPKALEQIEARKRFREVAFDPHSPAALRVAPLTRRRQHAEADARQGGIYPDPRGELEAVVVRHLRVDDDEIKWRALRLAGAAGRARGRGAPCPSARDPPPR